MVILIGGSSHVGKTLVAHRLMIKHSCPYLSLDYLKSAFVRTSITQLTMNDDYEMRYFMWPFVREIIVSAIESKRDLIVEGCYIPNEWKNSFTAGQLKSIKCVYIVMSDDYIRNNFNKIGEYADAIEHRQEEELNMERLISCSTYFAMKSREYGDPCIEICGEYSIDELADSVERSLGLSAPIKSGGYID